MPEKERTGSIHEISRVASGLMLSDDITEGSDDKKYQDVTHIWNAAVAHQVHYLSRRSHFYTLFDDIINSFISLYIKYLCKISEIIWYLI